MVLIPLGTGSVWGQNKVILCQETAQERPWRCFWPLYQGVAGYQPSRGQLFQLPPQERCDKMCRHRRGAPKDSLVLILILTYKDGDGTGNLYWASLPSSWTTSQYPPCSPTSSSFPLFLFWEGHYKFGGTLCCNVIGSFFFGTVDRTHDLVLARTGAYAVS